MKKSFVNSWNSSKQPRKQRKYRYNAALHVSGKFLSVNLSKDLRKKYTFRSLRARKGDKIKVMRGQHKGKVGKIDRISLKYVKIYVNGIEMLRKDGTKTLIPLEPSNLQLTELDLSDKKRMSKNGKKTS
ncbi:MAG: 50S ribosomal protein L24 [Candidatus Woesearchaeota archaeon]